MSNGRNEAWFRAPASWDASGHDAQSISEVERALLAAESTAGAMAAAGDAVTWEARRHELEEAVSLAARCLETALRSSGLNELSAQELRLADLVRALENARPPTSFGEVALEAEIIAALVARPVGTASDGYARKEAEVDALLRELSVADSRRLVSRIEKRNPSDALVLGFYALSSERRTRLLATLRGAAKREAMAGEPARRAALAARASVVFPAQLEPAKKS